MPLYRLLASLPFLPLAAFAAELEIRLDNPPTNRAVVVMLFDSAGSFVKLREPVRTQPVPAPFDPPLRISGLPAGEYAVVVYEDGNGNGRLDRNFIGIPSEPLAFSNRYWPKGPPTYELAAFRLAEDERRRVDLELKSVFGKRGLFGAGVGVVASSNPYRGAGGANTQVIPAISYIGERLQVLGLTAQADLAGSGPLALALTGSFRPGAYEEDDSPRLEGLGDRDNTLMAGLGVRLDLPRGMELSAGYEHDTLDRIGGGLARLSLDRSWQVRRLTLSPRVALNWLSADLAGAEYGVPASAVRADRPAHRPGAAVTAELGAGGFVELRRGWRLVWSGGLTFLPDEITASPIVDDSRVWSGFAALNRVF